MRLHRLEISGFGPFKTNQVIDFDTLSKDGLFMLEGPTGSGKTSIIDAIVWVLYGTTAHQAGSSDGANKSGLALYAERVRSHYCTPDEETRVVLEFSNGGAEYRIQRTPAYDVPKARGIGLTTRAASARLEFINPVHEGLTRIDEVARKVDEIIGMNAGQFAQLVVLPQGDFATFLKATSDKRKELLQSIFKTYFYDDMQEYFNTRRVEIEQEIEVRYQDISRHVKNLKEKHEGGEDSWDFQEVEKLFIDPLETAMVRDRMLFEVCADLTVDLEHLTEEYATLDKEIEPIRKEITELDQVKVRIKSRNGHQSALDLLLKKQAEIDLIASQIALRNQIAPLEPILGFFDEKSVEASAITAGIPEDFTGLDSSAIKAKIVEIKAKIEVLAKEDHANADISIKIDDKKKLLKQAKDIEKAIKSLPKAQKDLLESSALVEGIKSELKDCRKRQADLFAPLVASTLQDGQACPVCGSESHPKLASAEEDFDPEVILDEERELEAKLNEEIGHNTKLAISESEYAKLSTEPTESSAEIENSIALLKAQAEKSEGIKTDLASAREEISVLEENQPHIRDLERLSKEIADFDKQLKTKMVEIGIETITDLRTAIAIDTEAGKEKVAQHHNEVTSTKALLAQADLQDLPEVAEIDLKVAERREQLALFENQRADIDRKVGAAERTNLEIEIAQSTILGQWEAIDTIREFGQPVLDLAKQSKGDNTFGLSLTNFVLQERLEAILNVASQHLAQISGHKYEFRLNEEKTGHQRRAGLGITIMDYSAGKERAAETLSGGEMFYASLALALGLAEIVKADQGGIELGTLFIDEGFGSLSGEKLDEVLAVLNEIRSNDRVIGVISHVEAMKSEIPTRLEVRRFNGSGPSSVRISVGEME